MKPTRQQLRHDCEKEAKRNWRGDQIVRPVDQQGVVLPRKVRRAIARDIARRAFKKVQQVLQPTKDQI